MPPSPRLPPDPLPSLRRISGPSATWRRPGPGRDGGRPRAPGTRERRETQRPGSPPTQIPSASGPTTAPPGLPGAFGEPLPQGQRRRRYLGCRSGGTWRRPRAPGSSAECLHFFFNKENAKECMGDTNYFIHTYDLVHRGRTNAERFPRKQKQLYLHRPLSRHSL